MVVVRLSPPQAAAIKKLSLSPPEVTTTATLSSSSSSSSLDSQQSVLLNESTEVTSSGANMTAKAVLLCQPTSHPFQERTLALDQKVKIGRSVARARPAANNAIFDCKVLSRNHALLHFENGKFFLQDTKSSNGTFVNNQRLSKGSEDSLPREVFSGDIVQFGVDVTENSRKVIHGCIVATLKLYLPDGKEAKSNLSSIIIPTSPGSISTQDLYQLAQCLQEALHREQMLENKLAMLQRLMVNTEEVSETSWKAMIDEDRLLTRLEVLEGQLQAYSKNFSDDRLREEVSKLQEDKDTYQYTAKESLKKVLQEKIEVVRKLQDTECSLNNAEEECVHLKEVYDAVQKELQVLAEKYNTQLIEVQILTRRLQEAESKQDAKKEESENNELQNEDSLDDSRKDITLPLSRSGRMLKKFEMINDDESQKEAQVDLILEQLDDVLDSELDADDYESTKASELRQTEKELDENKSKVSELGKKFEKAQAEAVKTVNRVAQVEVQLQEAKSQLESSNALVKQLQEQVKFLEEELSASQQESEKNEATLTVIYKNEQNQQFVQSNGNVNHMNHIGDSVPPAESNYTQSLKTEIEKLKELLTEAREKKKVSENDVARYKGELEDAKNNVKKAADDANSMKQQLNAAQQLTKEKTELIAKLQEQLSNVEGQTKDENYQIVSLKEKLNEEQQLLSSKQEEANSLRHQLQEAQQNWKQSRNEVEQLKSKVKVMTTELEVAVKRYSKGGSATGSPLRSKDSQNEVDALMNECVTMRQRVSILENELGKAQREKERILEDYEKFSGGQKPIMTAALSTESLSLQDPEKVMKEAEAIKKQLLQAQSEIVSLKEKCAMYNEETTRLRQDLKALGDGQPGAHQTSLVRQLLIPIILAGLIYLICRW